MSSNAIHENKKRRATQIVTGSFPCRKWLHKLHSHISPFCELCRKEREASGQPTDNLPLETVAHIQSAGCKAQKQCVTQAHNSCWKFLLRSIMASFVINVFFNKIQIYCLTSIKQLFFQIMHHLLHLQILQIFRSVTKLYISIHPVSMTVR